VREKEKESEREREREKERERDGERMKELVAITGPHPSLLHEQRREPLSSDF
jgi:hypothetical protein